MPSLQVRDLPEAIYRKLKQQARSKHRTLAQQAVATLAQGLEVPLDPKSRRRRILELLQEKARKTAAYKLTDPTQVIREDRNR